MLAVEPAVAAERLVRKREGEAGGIAVASADGGENLRLAKIHHRRADGTLVPRVVAETTERIHAPAEQVLDRLVVVATRPDRQTTAVVGRVRDESPCMLFPCGDNLGKPFQVVRINEPHRDVGRAQVPVGDQIVEVGDIADKKARKIPASGNRVVTSHLVPWQVGDRRILQQAGGAGAGGGQWELLRLQSGISDRPLLNSNLIDAWIGTHLNQKDVSESIISVP